MTTQSDDRADRAERLSRLDQLERDIAAERERLNRPDVDNRAPDTTAQDTTAQDTTAARADDRYPDRATDDDAEAETARGRHDSVRTVDLPELEERVTESQREAWALGYQAGVADSQTRTGTPTQNPFHPLRGR